MITVILNYFLDTMGIFNPEKGLRKAAKSLLAGNMIAGLGDIDDRKFQELIVDTNKNRVSEIVLGSSRSLQLEKNIMAGKNHDYVFLNHSVPRGTLDDFIAIIGLYMSKKKYIPKTVVLAADPWLFNVNNEIDAWKSLKPFHEYVLRGMYGKKIKDDIDLSSAKNKYKLLINWQYTVKNIISLKRKSMFYITENENINDDIRRPDGSLVYPVSIRLQSDDEGIMKAKAYARGPVHLMENFDKLSNIKLFEDFLNYIADNDSEVIILLIPFHPVAYNLLINNPKYNIMQGAEVYLKNLCSKNNFRILGSYDPEKNNLQNNDFFDGVHMKESGFRKIIPPQKNSTRKKRTEVP
ncbi:MAG: DUF1574 family protein [Proteobacteria bacterium]|nr:DUF1574 family protein [Pseudomonadota bacterium]